MSEDSRPLPELGAPRIYDLGDLHRLLLYSYAELEQLRRAAHRDPVVACAARIKEFMQRHAIATVKEGLARYAASLSRGGRPARARPAVGNAALHPA